MALVGLRHIGKEEKLNRLATGSVTTNTYAADSLGRIQADTTDAPKMIAGGEWAVDGPAGVGFYSGSGAPTFNATAGSLYTRTDGSSSSTRLYINTSAGQGTTWIAISTAS
jgi:hypothetical protein